MIDSKIQEIFRETLDSGYKNIDEKIKSLIQEVGDEIIGDEMIEMDTTLKREGDVFKLDKVQFSKHVTDEDIERVSQRNILREEQRAKLKKLLASSQV